MKGTINGTTLGNIEFDIHDGGIVLFKSLKAGHFDGKQFRFKARIDEDSVLPRIISTTPHHKPATLQKEIQLRLPAIWERLLEERPSLKLIATRRIVEKDRTAKVKELRDLFNRIQNQLSHAFTILDEIS